MKAEKIIHKGWEQHQKCMMIKEYKDIMVKNYPNGIFGKYHYIFTSDKGKISLISLEKGAMVFNDKKVWEIFAYENEKLFSDVERFGKKSDAVKRIRELLE